MNSVSFIALVSRLLRFRSFRRIISLLLMTALLAPLTFSFGTEAATARNDFAGNGNRLSAGNTGAPEPFSFNGNGSQNLFSNFSVLNHPITQGVFPSAAEKYEKWQRLQQQIGFWQAIGQVASVTSHRTLSSLGSWLPKSAASSASLFEPFAAALPLMPVPTGTTAFDFDGDGKADVSRFNPAANQWRFRSSSNGSISNSVFGSAGVSIVPANYDGDTKTDFATFNASSAAWSIQKSSDGTTLNYTFGASGDKPVPADYDSDGKADLAVWRPSNGTWHVLKSSDGLTLTQQFGQSGDIPVVGNYDGDSKADFAVFRSGTWLVLQSSTGNIISYAWGLATDIPVPADFDGDGKTDYSVYRRETGAWYAVKSSLNNGSYLEKIWGNYGDQPVPADYDGDSKADFAVWRPTTGVWYLVNSASSTYSYYQMGAAGDAATPAAYLKQSGLQVSPSTMAKARMSPKNATGGTNLYSRNFSWGTSLVGLPGRAGMDLGIGLSYNSLVWTKDGGNLYFDADSSNLTAGFRFGFPVIEPSYLDSNIVGGNQFAYLMVGSSGGRTEFRQISASNIYEAADSSYLQLEVKAEGGPNTPIEDLVLVVRATDGTQMRYTWSGGAYRCAEIKDSNGNYITVNHNEYGDLQSVTDTLGRTINFNYYPETSPDAFLLQSITQSWQSGTHTWATFTYAAQTINPSFQTGLEVVGPTNNASVRMLQKVTYPNGGFNTFEYNSYGQVFRVNTYAADNHKLNHAAVNLDNSSISAGQPDCPRFSETRTWAENFNNGAEVAVANLYQEGVPYSTPAANGTGTLLQVTAPDGTISKTFVYPAGDWKEGLPVVTETWSGGARKRWTFSQWTQDNTAVAYILNPRVAETQVGDVANTKKTGILYHPSYGLVSDVTEFNVGGATQLRRTHFEYNLNQSYTSRRIIGLPSERTLYNENNHLVGKVTFGYDEFGFSESWQTAARIRHDAISYGAGFQTGRGLPTSVTRYDVTGATASVASQTKYDVSGSAVTQIDALGRQTQIRYTDAFQDVQNTSTYAYPTTLTDAAGYSSTIQYRFDYGATTRAQSPAPAGHLQGRITTGAYDSIGRLERVTTANNGAYTRYVYPSSHNAVETFATLVEGLGEAKSETHFDGAGRVRRTRAENPGSIGGWSGSLVEYDAMGRAWRQTPATEIDANWQPVSDDYRGANVWLWTSHTFDWKSRPLVTTNTDGTTTEASYDGCGCAGGEVVTLRGEQIDTLGRRVQKIYHDILGRAVKTEVYDWNGAGAPYTTTVNTFNARDQITNTRQYAGAEGAAPYQEVLTTYDGHGRLKTRHYPIEDAGTVTTWNYNSDDSVSSVTDPRGAIVNYTYNDLRGLLTNISYTQPPNNPAPPDVRHVPAAPSVSFAYDAVGNRTSMTEGAGGTGATNYAYNQLSQLVSETKTLTGLAGSYTVSYDYHLSGALKSVTDPFQSTVNYANDKTGRLTAVSGTPFGDNTTGEYADGIKYRAWGAVKELYYKTSVNSLITMQYDARLRVTEHKATNHLQASGYVKNAAFEYHADSRPRAMDNRLNDRFDRTFSYDFAGRLTQNQFGNGQVGIPYSQTIAYDAFSQMTSRTATHWNRVNGFTASYQNGRKQAAAYEHPLYDAAGNLLDSDYTEPTSKFQRSTFDAANRQTLVKTRAIYRVGLNSSAPFDTDVAEFYDGDGRAVKQTKQTYRVGTTPQPQQVKYQIWSSVLKSALTELKADGTKQKTKVFAGGAVVAEQMEDGVAAKVEWIHADPVTGSHQKVWKDGTTDDYWRIELEPLGQEISPIEPLEEAPEYQPQSVRNPEEPEWLCSKTMIGGLSFHERPIQCKKAALEQGQRLDTLFYREERGNMIKLTDSPLWRKPSFAPGATAETNPQSRLAERARSKALKSSNKDDVESEKNRKERTFQVNITTEFLWDTEYLWDREQLSAEFGRDDNFNLGRNGGTNTHGFNDEELNRLKTAWKYINTQSCKDFLQKMINQFNQFMKDHRLDIQSPYKTADDLINAAKLNKYSWGLTAEQVGSQQAHKKMTDSVQAYRENGAEFFAGAAVPGQVNIWLSDAAFRTKVVTEYRGLFRSGISYPNYDLPAVIAHELLHVLGWMDPRVANMNSEIQKACGTGVGVVGQ